MGWARPIWENRSGLVLRAEKKHVLEGVLKNDLLVAAAGRLAPGVAVRLSGMWGSSAPLVAAALGRLKNAPVLFLAAHVDDADDVADDIEIFTHRPAQLFPAWEPDIAADHINDETVGQRLRLCNLLSQPAGRRQESVDFIVAPVMSLLQPVPSPEALAAARLSLQTESQLSPEALVGWLVDAGFERVDQVDQQGQFARRGGIVDVFVPGFDQAVRVEFFGETIESIRRVDLDTQRSTGEIDGCDLMAISAGRQTDRRSTRTLLSYLPPETIICMVEPTEVAELARQIYDRLTDAAGPAGSTELTAEVPGGERLTAGLISPDDLLAAVRRFPLAEMYAFVPKPATTATNLSVRSLQKLAINTQEALGELGELSEVAEVWVYCENPAEEARFAELIGPSHPKLAGRVHTAIGHVHSGFYWPAQRLVVVGHHEIFHRYAKLRRLRRIREGRPIESMLDLQHGDYVVHVAHGIARFEGLRTLQRDGRSEEFLTLRFAGNALLHVPAGRINLVQKYVGARRWRPTLSRLGGTGWSRRKQQVGEAVRDLAAEMLRIQAMRKAAPGESFPLTSDWQRRFCQEFVYAETEDQIVSMRQIDDDMSAARPMDRLLCGDVGYGKTELAMRAAFKVAEKGKQVAVLVPTTVLAAQHYRTFCERLADYPFAIEVLSRFQTPQQQANIVKRLKQGRIDIIIGTHRMLSGDVGFAELGLLVIDEEQRFGVAHKEHLKGLRATVDLLTMTATPIPRTLHMALLGLRDISALATPPLDRRAIHTEVCHYDQTLIRQAILRELNRQGQTFFVHNRVFSIEGVAERIQKLVPEARIAVAHGQMPEGQLEQTMLKFVNRQIDVLICTTIIESGLDIPAANTIFIHDADRFGLAELHQLRGRVGRYKHRAYCYLLLPEARTISPAAAKRLKAIEEFSDLGAGFQIAMRDLEIRGAGNILGRAQSGHIAAVGYELYCRLLEEAVGELRGTPAAPSRYVHVELGLEAHIPPEYVPAERQRMEIYRRMARCGSIEELQQLASDLRDAYGPVPPAAELLLELAEVRLRAGELGINSIIRMDPDIIFSISDFSATGDLFDGAAGTVRLPDDHTVHWRPPPAYLQTPTLIKVLLKRLRQAHAKV